MRSLFHVVHARALWALLVLGFVGSAAPVWAVPIDTGSITISGNWATVLFSQPLANPVVVPSLPTTGTNSDAILQVRNVSSSGFQMRLAAPDVSGPVFASQVAGWLAVEAGTHTFGGTTIAAGLILGADSILGDDLANLQAVSLPVGFSSAPVVLGATQTSSASDFILARATNVTTSGFQIGYQREESLETIPHAPETLGWIAWEQGTQVIGNLIATAVRTPDVVNDAGTTYAINGFDPGTNLDDGSVFGLLNTWDGGDPTWVSGTSPVGTTLDLFADEETSFDLETAHTTESVGLLALVVVPEPSTALLVGVGLGGLALRRPEARRCR